MSMANTISMENAGMISYLNSRKSSQLALKTIVKSSCQSESIQLRYYVYFKRHIENISNCTHPPYTNGLGADFGCRT